MWDFSAFDSKLNLVFKSGSFLFKSHYEHKYFPKAKKQTTLEVLERSILYLGKWAILLGVYGIAFYLAKSAEFQPPLKLPTVLDKLLFIKNHPVDVFIEVYGVAGGSFWFNALVVYLLYRCIQFYSEKDFLHSHFTHHKSGGLIKTIKVGKFTNTGFLKEENLDQVDISRRTLHGIIAPDEKRRVTVVALSGWDFFGAGPALNQATPSAPQVISKWKFWKRLKTKKHVDNGYLLDQLKHCYAKFEIVLLDPKSQAAQARAGSYLSPNAHKNVIANAQQYSDSITKCLHNINNVLPHPNCVEVRLSDRVPDWKMIISDGEVWVQPVIPGVRSDHTPMYGFKCTETSMYHAFHHQALEIWKSAVPINLSDWCSKNPCPP